MQYETILKNGFAWIRDKQVWTYIIAMIAIGLIGVFTVAYILQDFLAKFFPGAIETQNFETIGLNLLMEILQLLFLFFVLFLVFAFIEGFVYTLILLRGMEFYKIKTTPFELEKYIRLVVLHIFSGILALISYYDKRFLMVFIGIVISYGIGFLLLAFINILGFILLILAIFATLFYVLVVVYNEIRLSMAPFIFLEKEQGIFDSLRQGWNLTKGKVIDVFIGMLIIGIIIWLVSSVTNYFAQFIASILFPGFTSNLTPTEALQMFSLLIQNLTTFLLIVSVPSIIIGSIMKAFQAFGYAGIYSQVKGKK